MRPARRPWRCHKSVKFPTEVLPGAYRIRRLCARVCRRVADDEGMKPIARLFLLSLLLAGSLGAAPQAQWGELKVGISARQTLSLLGRPLFQRHGKGFETWTYDHGAEVLLYGGNAVVGWTAPASANLAVRSLDVWSLHANEEAYATLYSALETSDIVPPTVIAPKENPKPAPAIIGQGYEQFLRGG